MSEALFVGLAVLVLIAGVVARRRVRAARSVLSDDLIRQIETEGRVDAEDVDPLDLETAREEEDVFWSQTWDEPEEIP